MQYEMLLLAYIFSSVLSQHHGEATDIDEHAAYKLTVEERHEPWIDTTSANMTGVVTGVSSVRDKRHAWRVISDPSRHLWPRPPRSRGGRPQKLSRRERRLMKQYLRKAKRKSAPQKAKERQRNRQSNLREAGAAAEMSASDTEQSWQPHAREAASAETLPSDTQQSHVHEAESASDTQQGWQPHAREAEPAETEQGWQPHARGAGSSDSQQGWQPHAREAGSASASASASAADTQHALLASVDDLPRRAATVEISVRDPGLCRVDGEPMCKHGGECNSRDEGGAPVFFCACAPAWGGEFCQRYSDPCTQAASDCGSLFSCRRDVTNRLAGFSCQCDQRPGWQPVSVADPRCERVTSCRQGNPCRGGGTCRQVQGGFVCVCPPTSAGDFCQVDSVAAPPTMTKYQQTAPGTGSLTVAALSAPELWHRGSYNQQLYPRSSTDQQLYPRSSPDQQLYPRSSTDQQLYPRSSPDQQLYPRSSPDQQLYPRSSTDQQLYPRSSPDQQLYTRSSPNQQLYPRSSPGQQLYSRSSTGQQLYPRSSPDQQLYTRSGPNQQLYPRSSPNQRSVRAQTPTRHRRQGGRRRRWRRRSRHATFLQRLLKDVEPQIRRTARDSVVNLPAPRW